MNTTAEPFPKLLRRPEVERITGLSTSSIYRALKKPDSGFPQPIRIGLKNIAWRAEDIERYLSRPTSTNRQSE